MYKTGFFKNVDVYKKGNELIIFLKENPTIASIKSGNKEIASDNLNKALKSMGLISGDVFDNSILVAVKQALLQQYYNLGYYNARIETKITPTSENRVKIDLLVKEGVIAKIKDINIIGNRDYSEQQLLDALNIIGNRDYSEQQLLERFTFISINYFHVYHR